MASERPSAEHRARKANEARAEKAKAQHAVTNPRAGEKSGVASNDAGPNRDHAAEAKAKTTAAIARMANVSTPTVERELWDLAHLEPLSVDWPEAMRRAREGKDADGR